MHGYQIKAVSVKLWPCGPGSMATQVYSTNMTSEKIKCTALAHNWLLRVKKFSHLNVTCVYLGISWFSLIHSLSVSLTNHSVESMLLFCFMVGESLGLHFATKPALISKEILLGAKLNESILVGSLNTEQNVQVGKGLELTGLGIQTWTWRLGIYGFQVQLCLFLPHRAFSSHVGMFFKSKEF